MAVFFGARFRKGVVVTTVTVAALSASQGPWARTTAVAHASQAATRPEAGDGPEAGVTGQSPYYTDLPPLNSTSPSSSPSLTAGKPVSRGEAEAGIPATVLDGYKKAETELRSSKPGCNLPWQLLAAIGKVESGQARGGRVDANGTTLGRILGPQLDGNGFALIRDTDHGAYDGNSTYDAAVGPMQFIPSTWAWASRDGNGDGKKDPNNIYDAALAAGHYLCRNNWDMSTGAGLHSAILSYNNSHDYLNLVLSWLEYYRKGTHSVPDGTGGVPSHRSDDTPRHRSKPSHPPKTKPEPGKPGGGHETPGPKPPKTKPEPSKPGGSHETPDPKPPKPPLPPTPPTPSQTVDHLEDTGTGKLNATVGDTFGQRISTRAETESGAAVAKVRIRFTITGDVDATFADGETVATIATDAKGVAIAPVLQAGEQTGDFKITAAVVDHKATGVDYTATVTARAADTLARTSDTPLTCTPGGEFADQIQVKATYKGTVADKVAATATLIKSADDSTENDKGPYFKDTDGKTVRTLTGLQTDDKGLLTLPKLYADGTTGTFLLRIITPGDTTLTIELTVATADATASEDPSPSPTPSP